MSLWHLICKYFSAFFFDTEKIMTDFLFFILKNNCVNILFCLLLFLILFAIMLTKDESKYSAKRKKNLPFGFFLNSPFSSVLFLTAYSNIIESLFNVDVIFSLKLLPFYRLFSQVRIPAPLYLAISFSSFRI